MTTANAEPTTLCGVCGEAVTVTPDSLVQGSGGNRPTSIAQRYNLEANTVEYGVDFEWIRFLDHPGGVIIHAHEQEG